MRKIAYSIKRWRLQPRSEALVRLRYANVLFEETDNIMEAETALSKGVWYLIVPMNGYICLQYQDLIVRTGMFITRQARLCR